MRSIRPKPYPNLMPSHVYPVLLKRTDHYRLPSLDPEIRWLQSRVKKLERQVAALTKDESDVPTA